MPLPTCECNAGVPIQQQLANIYCALFELVEGGGGGGSAPILGEIKFISGTTIPALWLSADGQEVSRATYADYFALVGTTYGAGNGTTTFNVPDARARALVAPDAGANRLTGATMSAVTAGGTGGAETHVLGGSVAGGGNGEQGSGTLPAGGVIAAGTDFENIVEIGTAEAAHNNVQPTLIVGGAIVYVGV